MLGSLTSSRDVFAAQKCVLQFLTVSRTDGTVSVISLTGFSAGTVEFSTSIASRHDSMRFTDEMPSTSREMFLPRSAAAAAAASDRNIGYTKERRKKRGKKGYHPCVSEPRSRAAAEVEEQRGTAEAHTRRHA